MKPGLWLALLLFLWLVAVPDITGSVSRTASAQPGSGSVRLAWRPVSNPLVVGYRIHYGTQSGEYTHTVQVKGRLSAQVVVENLDLEKTYFFSITSCDARGKESDFSVEVTNRTPKMPPSRRVTKSADGKILRYR